MRYFFGFFIFLSACAHTNHSSIPSSNIISYQSSFEEFWKKAKGQTFEKQLEFWDKIVEKPHQDFYDSFVWTSKLNLDFEARRKKRMAIVFDSYLKNEKRIVDEFKKFDGTIREQFEKFRETFTGITFEDQLIIGALTPTFNGRASHLKSDPDRVVLAFGIDMIVDRKDDPNILYSHELFHIYHARMSGITDDGEIEGASIIIPLWSEGIASYASYELNPNANLQDVFMDQKLADMSDGQQKLIAKEFLKISNHSVSDSEHPNTFRDWFTMNQTFDKRFPSRCGYWLGFQVVKLLREQYSLQEMAKWDAQKVKFKVLEVLRHLAKG